MTIQGKHPKDFAGIRFPITYPKDSKEYKRAEIEYKLSVENYVSGEKIKQIKEDARLYSALCHILRFNLIISHDLTSKPDDEYSIDYQSRLKVSQMIASEFKKLTGKVITGYD